MTKASIVKNRPARTVRNAVFSLLGQIPPARRQMALNMSELA
jgi:hypothetical protein